jgi:5-methylcytosine-specific restriction endonuclease McrA
MRKDRLSDEHQVRRVTYNELVAHAKKLGVQVTLTQDQAFQLCKLPCHYCGDIRERTVHSKSGTRTAWCSGIDRKDSTVGYTEQNSVPCCWPCNRGKGKMPYRDFLAYIDQVTSHNLRKVLDKIRQTI